jgi:hypothetical protein
MRILMLKIAFVLATLFLFLVFLVPACLLLDDLPYGRTPAGGQDRLFVAVPIIAVCLLVANRLVSSLFLRTGLSDERWSLFAARTFG